MDSRNSDRRTKNDAQRTTWARRTWSKELVPMLRGAQKQISSSSSFLRRSGAMDPAKNIKGQLVFQQGFQRDKDIAYFAGGGTITFESKEFYQIEGVKEFMRMMLDREVFTDCDSLGVVTVGQLRTACTQALHETHDPLFGFFEKEFGRLEAVVIKCWQACREDISSKQTSEEKLKTVLAETPFDQINDEAGGQKPWCFVSLWARSYHENASTELVFPFFSLFSHGDRADKRMFFLKKTLVEMKDRTISILSDNALSTWVSSTWAPLEIKIRAEAKRLHLLCHSDFLSRTVESLSEPTAARPLTGLLEEQAKTTLDHLLLNASLKANRWIAENGKGAPVNWLDFTKAFENLQRHLYKRDPDHKKRWFILKRMFRNPCERVSHGRLS